MHDKREIVFHACAVTGSAFVLNYTAINPLVPGTSVSLLPVAQLLFLFPLTFWLSRKLFRYVRPD